MDSYEKLETYQNLLWESNHEDEIRSATFLILKDLPQSEVLNSIMSAIHWRSSQIPLFMSSLHHFPKDQVESAIIRANDPLVALYAFENNLLSIETIREKKIFPKYFSPELDGREPDQAFIHRRNACFGGPTAEAILDDNPDGMKANTVTINGEETPAIIFAARLGSVKCFESLVSKTDLRKSPARYLPLVLQNPSFFEKFVQGGFRFDHKSITYASHCSKSALKYLHEHRSIDLGSSIISAAEEGWLPTLHYILDSGISSDFNDAKNDKFSALHAASMFNHSTVVYLLKHYNCNINSITPHGKTALLLASKSHYESVINALLDCGADVNIPDKKGNTCLMRVIDSPSLVDLFLSKGAQVDRKNSENVTALFKCNDHVIANKLLLAGAEVDSPGIRKQTPLMYASSQGNIDLMRLYLEKGANVNASDKNQNTPLICAVLNKQLAAVQMLLGVEGINVNAQNRENHTAMDLAVRDKSTEIVNALTMAGVPLPSEKSNERSGEGEKLFEKSEKAKKGDSPEELANAFKKAITIGNQRKVAMFLSKGVDINQEINNLTPLQWAASHNNIGVLKQLIKANADLNGKGKAGNTALHAAARKGRKESIAVLVDANADINTVNDAGHTPLYEAVKEGKEEAVKTLLQKGADVNIMATNGLAPLHVAVLSRNKNVVKMLIDKGANKDVKNKEDKSPLDIAVEKKLTDIETILKE